jgi:DNA-binding response OmpR family regulator
MTMLGRPRVLVVEDDPDLLVVLRVNLESVGIEPILASDGSTAIARIQAERPDAVLLDMMLPGLDGWQVLADLHQMNDPVPIVVCSAKKNPEDMARARELGAHAYVVKPFDIDRLLDAVLDATGRAGHAADVEWAAEPGIDGLEPA